MLLSSVSFRSLVSARPLYLLMACCIAPTLHAANTVIDVMALYTPGGVQLYAGDIQTRLNHMMAFTNQVYTDSGVNLELRLVTAQQVNYTDDNNAETALRDMTNRTHSAFSTVAGLREQYAADMVVLYRPYRDVHGSCGIAWVGGMNSAADFSNSSYKGLMYSHVALNTCGDYVTAHELGHNMGLKHSRRQDGSGGTTAYALGYGVVGSFTTIMAYQSSFSVDYWAGKEYKFANPELTCRGVPCGVDRNNSQGADARFAINLTGPQIANFFGTQNPAIKGELELLYQQMLTAKTAYETAAAAVIANQNAITTKKQTDAAAKADLAAKKKILSTQTSLYNTALKNYTNANNALIKLQKDIVAAEAKYAAATTSSTQTAALTALNALKAKLPATESLVTSTSAALETARQALATATDAVNAAITVATNASTALSAEKALTAGLKATERTALSAFKAAEKAYNDKLKAVTGG